jgi:hypothetical protein
MTQGNIAQGAIGRGLENLEAIGVMLDLGPKINEIEMEERKIETKERNGIKASKAKSQALRNEP